MCGAAFHGAAFARVPMDAMFWRGTIEETNMDKPLYPQRSAEAARKHKEHAPGPLALVRESS